MRQHRLDRAVHQQVGVAADRAGEVRVGLVRQAEVADIVRAVHRLLHRAQQHGLQHRRVGTGLDLVHHLGVVRCLRLVAAAQRQAGGAQEVAQVLQLLFAGARVDAVQRRVLEAFEEVGRAYVGGQHALLDQPVRVVARARQDLLDLALRVADDIGLGGVEVDRAALAPRLEQDLEQLVQVLQVRHQFGALVRLRTLGVGQDRPDLVVGQARGRVHHRGIELVTLEFTLGREHRIADHAQPVDVGIERAQPVGQLLRQHRDHAAGEVDGRGTVQRIAVQRRAGAHVVRHVGDRDDQAPALGTADLDRLAVDRIVEVARVFAVDGHQRDVAQVDAVVQVGLAHLIGQRGGFVRRRGREGMRHAVLAHRDLDFHAGIVDITEHFHHAAHRLHIAVGILDQLDTDHLPHARLALRLGRNQDVLADALVLGRDHQHAALAEQPPDHEAVGALDDLDDLPFGPAAAVIAHHAHLRTVVVHGLLQFALGQEDIVFAIVADQETETVAVALHAASDKVGLVGQFIAALAVQFDLAVAFHRRQALLEAVMLLARDRQGLGDIACRLRRSRRSQHAQDFFPAGDRIVILIQFFLETI
ncbi:hypothetical protein D9M72_405640 [compost metagenome]